MYKYLLPFNLNRKTGNEKSFLEKESSQVIIEPSEFFVTIFQIRQCDSCYINNSNTQTYT